MAMAKASNIAVSLESCVLTVRPPSFGIDGVPLNKSYDTGHYHHRTAPQGDAGKSIYCHPGPLLDPSTKEDQNLLRVVVTSIVLAAIGVAFLLVNPEDPAMRRFGWLVVVIGSVVAAVFTYLWAKGQLRMGEEPSGE